MNSPEKLRLLERFAELRAQEAGPVPDFAGVLERRSAAAPRPRIHAAWLSGSLAAVIALVALGWWSTAGPRDAAQMDASAWRTPTDALLYTPTTDWLRSLPDLRASVIPTPTFPVPEDTP